MTEENYNFTEFIYCGCGCGLTRPKYDIYGKEKKFIRGHNRKDKGWYVDNQGYRRVRCPPELRERFAHLLDKDGYVLEHRLVWEQSRDCCLLSWSAVHHINIHDLSPEQNKLDNSPDNLEGMMKSEHARQHGKGNKNRKTDMSGRRCVLCKSETTYIKPNGVEDWAKYNDGFICKKCSCKLYHIEIKTSKR